MSAALIFFKRGMCVKSSSSSSPHIKSCSSSRSLYMYVYMNMFMDGWMYIRVYMRARVRMQILSVCFYVSMCPHISTSWSQISFAKEPNKRDCVVQKRPVILRSLLIVATPYKCMQSLIYFVCVFLCKYVPQHQRLLLPLRMYAFMYVCIQLWIVCLCIIMNGWIDTRMYVRM